MKLVDQVFELEIVWMQIAQSIDDQAVAHLLARTSPQQAVRRMPYPS